MTITLTDRDNVPLLEGLLRPTIEALRSLGGSARNEEILSEVIRSQGVSESVAAIIHKDGRQSRLNYRLGWTRSYLSNSGMLHNSSHGVWSLTEKGERATDEDLAKVRSLVNRQTRERRAEGQQSAERRQDRGQTAAVIEENGLPEIQDSWKDSLIEAMLALKPDAFERLCQRLLRESGFVKVQVTGRSGDGGIDGTGILRVNLVSFQVIFQCKRYQGSVGPGAVRDFLGAMVGRADKGLIITTGSFTAAAQNEAVRADAPSIDLIDGEALCELLREHGLGVRTRMEPVYEVDRAWLKSI